MCPDKVHIIYTLNSLPLVEIHVSIAVITLPTIYSLTQPPTIIVDHVHVREHLY